MFKRAQRVDDVPRGQRCPKGYSQLMPYWYS
jgi:hypothetical protein